MGKGSLSAEEEWDVSRFFVKEGDGEGYLFEHRVDIGVLLGRGAGLRAVRGEVRINFVVGEDGGLRFEDLHGR